MKIQAKYILKYITEGWILPEDLQWIKKQLIKAHSTFIKVILHTGEIENDVKEIKETCWWNDIWNCRTNYKFTHG